MRQIAYIDPEQCIGCCACLEQCPVGAIRLQPGWFCQVDPAGCIGCGKCVSICHRSIPKLVGAVRSV